MPDIYDLSAIAALSATTRLGNAVCWEDHGKGNLMWMTVLSLHFPEPPRFPLQFLNPS